MQYALIKNGVVENVIEAEPSFIPAIAARYDHIQDVTVLREQGLAPGPGWLWTAETGYEAPPLPEPVVVVLPKHVSVGAFFDRFGANKYAILADQTPLVQALIKDVSVRAYIDLENPTLEQGLNLLVGAGYGIDVQAIITAPVLDSERP